MNNGLPSLLDAIFGKQDLASVSLDEMYELIKEFPSFNAAHFLLAKKLRQQNDAAYEKETMRTALYFNNPFWLQSLLDEGNNFKQTGRILSVKEMEAEDDDEIEKYTEEAPEEIKEKDNFTFEKYTSEAPAEIKEEINYTFEANTPSASPAPTLDELDEETEEILDEKSASETAHSGDTFQYAEPGPETITSFDELMAKYKIEPLDMVDETPAEIHIEPQQTSNPDVEIETIHASNSDLFIATNASSSSEGNAQQEHESHQDFSSKAVEINRETIPDSNTDQFETMEEVINEYGIFEKVAVKKMDQDHDLDAFDRPIDQIPFVSEKIPEEIIPSENSSIEENASIVENSLIIESQVPEDSPDKTDEHDYDAFDRPFEEPEIPWEFADDLEISDELSESEADNTDEPAFHSEEIEAGSNGQMQHLSDRFEEQQKSLAAFNAKNADSIVFTPYHMVDYFASQGIKLVMEDNPPDQFGKQLKSFTDWLKVMKKLPVQQSSEKTEEKEAEQIRHFAAHSIEERDILTESMAEVLAKQGMFENAIALYQKLSLIYPPKSAYFASRIDQLKASLP
jgi:hypothetical protein